ncbi:MAG: MGMT family protein [Spirochaetes bacterium]|nr:MGMT family protein [Spirochaetota bacterium]
MFEFEEFDKASFYEKIKRIIAEIPRGKVCTYGMIALLAGRPQNSRMVGRLLSSEAADNLPAHRVVNHKGRTAPGWIEQKLLLKQEGVVFKENGDVDLKLCVWKFSVDG